MNRLLPWFLPAIWIEAVGRGIGVLSAYDQAPDLGFGLRFVDNAQRRPRPGPPFTLELRVSFLFRPDSMRLFFRSPISQRGY